MCAVTLAIGASRIAGFGVQILMSEQIGEHPGAGGGHWAQPPQDARHPRRQ
jgi:hypothetical protein